MKIENILGELNAAGYKSKKYKKKIAILREKSNLESQHLKEFMVLKTR
jgi:hypothetical protein